MKKVYLAGKIAKNDWRHSIVPTLRESTWGAHLSIAPGVEYVGPFFTGCDHGCAHGPSTHGNAVSGCNEEYIHAPNEVPAACLAAIDQAGIVIAYIEKLDCYATYLELGYAISREKEVHLFFAESITEWQRNELWFYRELIPSTQKATVEIVRTFIHGLAQKAGVTHV